MELKLGYATPEAVRELFAEYTHMLVPTTCNDFLIDA